MRDSAALDFPCHASVPVPLLREKETETDRFTPNSQRMDIPNDFFISDVSLVRYREETLLGCRVLFEYFMREAHGGAAHTPGRSGASRPAKSQPE